MNKRILLIEDNPSDIELTLRAFDKTRIANEVIVAQDGQEAFDFLDGAGKWEGRDVYDLPALTLLDLKLPRLSGFDVLRHIRAAAHTRRMPVVILTSSREEHDITQGYTLGVNSYICKPVDFTQFLRAAEQLGLYWLIMNEPPPPVRR